VLYGHGLVLVSIATNPEKTAREIGNNIGLAERTTHKLIVDLEKEGYISKTKVGTHNIYSIRPDVELKDAVTDTSIAELLATLACKRKKRYFKNANIKAR
jgi:CTP-dependent riboflavin kinase